MGLSKGKKISVMGTKAQPQQDNHTLPVSDGDPSVSSDLSARTSEACKDSTKSHEVMPNMDAAWFFEFAPDAMVLADQGGRITLANSQTEKMFGYRREELIGQPVEKLMPERFRTGHVEHRSRYNAAPHTRPMGAGLELFGQHLDGHEFPIEISLAPLDTENGELISAAIRDITELRRTRELKSNLEFQKLMSRLSTTFINLPVERIDTELNNGLKDLAEVMNLDSVNINLFDAERASRTVTHFWSRPGVPPPPTGKIINESYPWVAGRIANREISFVSAVEDLPQEAAAEREYMLSTGLKSWLAIPLLVAGEHLATMGTGVFHRTQTWDETSISRFQRAGEVFASALARKRAAEARLESEERFRTVADTAPVLIWMSGTDKLCNFFNHGWLEFTGRTMEEELGRGWTSGVHPEDVDRCLDTYSAAFDARSEFTLEYRLRRHDGEYRWIVDRGVPRFDSGGRFLGYIGSCMDITDRKLSEHGLIERLKFETMLAELLATFVRIPANQLDDRIKEVQKSICETVGFDRSALSQLLNGELVVTHFWVAERFESVPPLPQINFPWILQKLLDGERVSFSRVDDLPDAASKDKESLRRYGLKSDVIFPLCVEGKTVGALSFGYLRAESEWPEALVERLNLTSQVFANALARKRADSDLLRAYGEIDALKRQLEKENLYLREEVKLEHHHREVIGDAEGIRRVLKKVEQVAPTDTTVLVLGETGTGKELIARTIHEHSRRKNRVMVKVNCAALPASLIESELFGREKGAFTGALTREMGRFELANGSTILLDEVGELPIELQSKLLRVLQEGEFERLGSPKTIKVDVRVIAATSKNLQQAVREGKFREDLFFRLNVFPITIPPLRERREDIPSLVWHFVNELSQRMGRSIETIQASTMEAFKTYYWPGNVRELRNVIERFLITSTNTVFRARLPIGETAATSAHSQTFEEVERNHILHILEITGWRVRGAGGAAEILGLKPTTLESRMQKLGISRHK